MAGSTASRLSAMLQAACAYMAKVQSPFEAERFFQVKVNPFGTDLDDVERTAEVATASEMASICAASY